MINTQPTVAPHIAIFDSGVGGLSILQAARQQLPKARFSYVSDNAGFPYGNKPAHLVIDRACQVLEAFAAEVDDVDVFVIACNTASTLALPRLRRHFTRPVVGVVPAIKPAAEISRNKYIGLLATPGTVKRSYTRRLIEEFASDCRVVSVGSSALVELAERKLRHEPVCDKQLHNILTPLLVASDHNPAPEQLDTLVLACTHFPLLAEEIAAVMGPRVRLVDSGTAIARRIAYWTERIDTAANSPGRPTYAWFTKADSSVQTLSATLPLFGFNDTRLLRNLI
ncbi:glutamate racemase [Gilvimarinus agarilyticus]|uniref:glutamate racemase n=1 Tax=Gilvimarinus agarilyticus TaxID=679259 RepID=UPI0006982404|nr:glutamate racemase [Gilvimarinus agarilyticus]